ncbi:MAG: MoaA/NifB/PqqE/SkfB family radical SAM enzyme [Bacteroidia bacterium]|jgi:MoaA/NifB/PqqE/SkfB family radical SAM enzyme
MRAIAVAKTTIFWSEMGLPATYHMELIKADLKDLLMLKKEIIGDVPMEVSWYIEIEKNTLKDCYTRPSDCKDCPYRYTCIGKSRERRISITAFRAE